MPDDRPEVKQPPGDRIEPERAPGSVVGLRGISGPILIAIAILGTSVVIAFGFVLDRGGLFLPNASSPTPIPADGPGVASHGATQTQPVTAAASDGSQASGAVTGVTSPPGSGPAASPGQSIAGTAASLQPTLPALTAQPSATPTAAALPVATSGPRGSVAPTPGDLAPASPGGGSGAPSASRLDLLTACPGRADCYVYVVRAGDNLVSIAGWFGVDLGRVRSLNPWIGSNSLIRPGQRLVIPTPTR